MYMRLPFGLLTGFTFISTLALSMIPAVTATEWDSQRVAFDLRRFVESPSRVVWVRDMGANNDSAALGDQLMLMGLDTEDRRGERPLLPNTGNYAKPLFLADGSGIIFTDRREGMVYFLPWHSEEPQELSEGFGLETWYDWETDTHWVYVARGGANRTYTEVIRFPMNDTAKEEVVWTRAPLSEDNFQLSSDGRFASGNFPWPNCGVADLHNNTWQRLGDGCWTTLAPDNSYRFAMLDGPHRNLIVFDRGGANRRVVPLNSAPGTEGFEVYQPRWTNHPAFLTMNGPYMLGQDGNTIGSGGPAVEIFVGRWNADFTAFEDWLQLTRSDRANFLSDVWIASGFKSWAPAEAAAPASESGNQVSAWPVGNHDWVMLWRNRRGPNVVEFPGMASRDLQISPRFRSRYGAAFEMLIDQGNFEITNAEDIIRSLVNESRSFYFELTLTADREKTDLRGLVAGISLGDQSTESFSLIETGGRLLFLTRWEGRNEIVSPRQFTVGNIRPGEPVHVAIEVQPGSVRGWMNGEPAFERSLPGRMAAWQPQPLTFGSLANLQQRWAGTIERIGFALNAPDEAVIQQHARENIAAIRARPIIPTWTVDAELIDLSPIPTVEAIAPYRRALVAHHYRVVRELEGEGAERDLLAARWVILDGDPLPGETRKVGETYRLQLQSFDLRPELEGERLTVEVDDPLLPLYLDVRAF
jgi:hypothetical protein